MARPRHGEVWLADLGLAAKTRPVVIVLADDIDVSRNLTIYIPITTQARGGDLEVPLGHLKFLHPLSVANVQAIGALPVVRLERKLGAVDGERIVMIRTALRHALGL